MEPNRPIWLVRVGFRFDPNTVASQHQEAQQSTVSIPDFNEMKNEFKNLTHMMSMMMRRFENQSPSPDSARLNVPSGCSFTRDPFRLESTYAAAIQINMPRPVPQFGHLGITQYKEEIQWGLIKKLRTRSVNLKDSSNK